MKHNNFCDSRINANALFFLLLFVSFLLNVVQAALTEIGNDEAYYWVYSRFPDWGYYDHPPVVAWVVKMGTLIAGDSTLGVRLFVILLQLLFLVVVYRISDLPNSRRNVLLFFILSWSVVMLQVYGFIATPDAPLLFFTAFFLWSYTLFLRSDGVRWSIWWMALCMAGLMYSKYHGAVVILLVFLSNWRALLKKPGFYLSVLLAAVLYLPHIVWQVEHDFPSLKYHLTERSHGFQWSYFPDFLLNQLPVFNPFTLGAVIYVLFHRKKRDPFEKALRFLIIGFFLFFTLWNFKGHVEPHWTVTAAVPMILLVLREADENRKLRRYLFRVVAPSIVLILVARLFLMVDILPIPTEWHGDKQRVADLHAVAGSRPVVFAYGFQMPSKYRFYTGGDAHAMGVLDYRNTQYDIWHFDEDYWGAPVVIDAGDPIPGIAPVESGSSLFYLKEVMAYQPYKRLRVIPSSADGRLVAGKENRVQVTVFNPYRASYQIHHPSMPLEITILLTVKDDNGLRTEKIATVASFDAETIPPGERVTGTIAFDLPELPKGPCSCFFATATPGIAPATLEKPIKIVIE